ncbi:tRNA-uridine aminocarboxypropyltransferase [Shewanella sp. NIFS-20-20]|uniref:tRNA-uridine aminocarboxypropyltransferase n=1 Tax=Shewanella sp. NIFS-20-20 TaxID=2853806 RepID=UPI001C458F8F|nr:tRNA-uridine aminocarboxypropyltransferase [Shewanella sp. NIFS-20-20]MBV7316662.1 DTW domain-containing protein [Shewanella sp. NIFS-20-20]
MSKRRYCPECEYPQTACLCASIVPIASRIQLVVLQHPAEADHAKNSVRLLSKVVPSCQVFVGETAQEFASARQYLQQQAGPVLLVYPSENSLGVESLPLAMPASTTLVLLDGTWRKALKMIKLNPWLSALPAVHLGDDYQGRYRIRKAKRSDSLSTLEAAAYTAAALDPTMDIQPILTAFDAMVERQIAAMPAEVRARYQIK